MSGFKPLRLDVEDDNSHRLVHLLTNLVDVDDTIIDELETISQHPLYELWSANTICIKIFKSMLSELEPYEKDFW